MPSGRGTKTGGGTKSNVVTGTEGPDLLRGTNGNDIIDGRGGADSMRGGRGNDIYYVDDAADSVIELAGEGLDEARSTIDYALAANVENLTLLGSATYGNGNALDNRLTGNEGANRLLGMEGSDFMVGGGGDDVLDGGTGSDHLDGGAGNDTYFIDNPTDFVFERFDGGTDTVNSAINYQISPEFENLTLIGGAYVGMGNYRDNQLLGNGLDNRLDGREGNDWLDGGTGNDTLIGGFGADSFAFTTAIAAGDSGNVDTIADFEAGVDRIVLDSALFTGLLPGTLPEEAFRVGSAAEDADDRIIYDPTTGNLWFDPDGNGSAAMTNFAAVGGGTTITAGDFTVVQAQSQQSALAVSKDAGTTSDSSASALIAGGGEVARILADAMGGADNSGVDALIDALTVGTPAAMGQPAIAEWHSGSLGVIDAWHVAPGLEMMAAHPDAVVAV